MRRLWLPAVAGALLVAFVAPASGATPDKADKRKQPYIVVLADPVGDPEAVADEHGRRNGAHAERVFRHALKGYTAKLTEDDVAELRADPLVSYVEPDAPVEAVTEQTGATWGLDRIDQRDLPLSGAFSYGPTGAGVRAYVIDTGIRLDHVEFGGRVTFGFDAFDGTGNDCNGHGTHVAGTIGGTTYGVAKATNLVAVRVLGCSGSGSTSGVIAGIDWVTKNAVKPAVANMSLGGGYSPALNQAVANSVTSGVPYAVAAGNSNYDACAYSPASTPSALTVGSTTSTDARSSFSNYGSCLDLFAPGSSITSAWSTGATATTTISGTSMATPHVAGAAAAYLQGNPGASPAAVESALEGAATPGKVTDAKAGSPNRLLYSAPPAAPAPEPPPSSNQPPTVVLTKSCIGTTCTFDGRGSSDPDGFITDFDWAGADVTGEGTAEKTYSGAGTYTVTLTAWDDDVASSTGSVSVKCVATGKGKNKQLSCS